MNKKILFVLALNWILLGCVSNAPISEGTSPLAGCRTQSSWFCRGNPQASTVNLNTKNKRLKASPYCVKAKKGTQLVFRLTPPGSNAINTVEIIPKDVGHAWLAATNSTFPDLIIIDVPDDLDVNEKYYYGVKTDSYCVDPRVRVEN